MNLAPIVLFVYNRLNHTEQTIEALQKNDLAEESELFIYSDEAKNEKTQQKVDEVRKYIDNIEGFKRVTVIKREKNFGLASSIINGVTKIINDYGKVIVLEDDLLTSRYFLKFMNESLNQYENNNEILSITGFNFSSQLLRFSKESTSDVLVHYRPMSWSWATWKDRWSLADWDVKDFDKFQSNEQLQKHFNQGGADLSRMLISQMNGNLDSWYIRWCYTSFKHNKLNIYPKKSFINNIGHDGSGVHCIIDKRNVYAHNEMIDKNNFIFMQDIVIDKKFLRSFNLAFDHRLLPRVIKYWRTMI